MKLLHLTSPEMSGPEVTTLQLALKQRGFYKGPIGTKYDPLTAQAVYRAKYRLGYLRPDHSAGDLILTLLQGHRSPSVRMVALAGLRARADAHKVKKVARKTALTHAQLVVQRALSQLGETEHPPASNQSKFSRWYGVVGPWCAEFVTWVHATLGFSRRTFKRGSRYAYVPFVVGDARAGRNGLMLAPHPTDATLACFDWNRDGTADHIGVCAEENTLRRLAPAVLRQAIKVYGPLGPWDFWSIEGNTGIGNDSNGGMVMLRKRSRSQVQAFVKVAT